MPVLLVRHASAGSRRKWHGDDADRPLDDRGRRQAEGLVDLLAPFEVVRVLSSPSVRCVQTVEPVAAGRGLALVPDDDLLEGHSRQAIALVRSLLAPGSSTAVVDGPAIVVSSHGDTIPDALDALAREGADLGDEPACKKGSTWVVWRGGEGVVGARYLPPPA